MSVSPKPIFDRKNLRYCREEKGGCLSVVSGTHPEVRELILNATTNEILGLCDGSRTMEEIARGMADAYPDVPQERIRRDVAASLGNLSHLGIITWISDDPFANRWEADLGDGFYACLAQEEDFRLVLGLLRQKDPPPDVLSLKSALVPDTDYTEVVVRNRLFNLAEEYFVLTRGPGLTSPAGFAAVGIPLTGSLTAASLNRLSAPRAAVAPFLSYVCGRLPVVSTRKVTKLKCFLSGGPDDRELEDIFLSAGCKLEGTLQDEAGMGVILRVVSFLYGPAPDAARQ